MERIVWWLLVKVTRLWSSRYMDQWEKIKFRTEYGVVYVSIMRHDDWPDSFDLVDADGRAITTVAP